MYIYWYILIIRHLMCAYTAAPFTLLGVHMLLVALLGQQSFRSWLAEFESVSSVLFCLAFSNLLLITAALYVLSRRQLSHRALKMPKTKSCVNIDHRWFAFNPMLNISVNNAVFPLLQELWTHFLGPSCYCYCLDYLHRHWPAMETTRCTLRLFRF